MQISRPRADLAPLVPIALFVTPPITEYAYPKVISKPPQSKALILVIPGNEISAVDPMTHLICDESAIQLDAGASESIRPSYQTSRSFGKVIPATRY